MRRIFFVGLGWTLVVIGVVVMPMPLPIPLIGFGPILIGCAILTAHSKSFRRGLQRLRHRFEWLSRQFDDFPHRGPHGDPPHGPPHPSRAPRCAMRACARGKETPDPWPFPSIAASARPMKTSAARQPLIIARARRQSRTVHLQGHRRLHRRRTEDVAVIDPGPDMPAHVEALKRALDGKARHAYPRHPHPQRSFARRAAAEGMVGREDLCLRSARLGQAR